jgi:diamine N-acetyltransferase
MPETTMVDPSTEVALRAITKENLREVLRLKVAPAQEQFVASNAVSLAQAHFYKEAWYRAIYAGETPVGFLMLSDDPVTPEYFLWRLMIDHRYQGRGYARRALDLLVDYVKTRPGAVALLVSHGEGEGSPGPFYQKLGFQYTGDVHEGELVMRLDLGTGAGEDRPGTAATTDAAGAGGSFTHVVLFRLRDRSPENVTRTVEVLRGMEGRIAVLRALEVGADVIRSPRSYDIGLIARFDSQADLEAYQVHPVHQDVLTYMGTVMETSVAVDYVGQQ